MIVLRSKKKKKTSYATFMLDKEVDHWWLMTRGFYRIRGLLFRDSLRRHFIRSTFLIVFDGKKKGGEFVRLEQRDLTVAQYEARFIELSRFAP